MITSFSKSLNQRFPNMPVFALCDVSKSYVHYCAFVEAKTRREAATFMIEKKEALIFITKRIWDEDTVTFDQCQESLGRMDLDALLDMIDRHNDLTFQEY